MPTFEYKAQRPDGTPTLGTTSAPTIRDAIAALEADGMVVKSIQLGKSESDPTVDGTELTATDSNDACLAGMERRLKPWWTLRDQWIAGLRAYAAEMPSGPVRRHFVRLADTAARAESLSSFLSATESRKHAVSWLGTYPHPPLDQPTATGILRAIVSSERVWLQNRQSIGRFAIYIVTLSVIAAGVLGGASIFVFPIVTSVLSEWNRELPFSLEHRLLTVLALPLGLGLVWLALSVLPKGARQFLGNRVPVLGRSLRFGSRAQFLWELAGLVAADLPAPLALECAGDLSDNGSLRRAARRTAKTLAKGHDPQPDDRATIAVSSLVIHALRQDASVTDRAKLIQELARQDHDRARAARSRLELLAEPVGLVFMGGVVLFVMLVVFGPIYALIQGLA
ncbi:MAG TPA: type II secretion system F family protein, partial [Pirellulaceae bacterium]